MALHLRSPEADRLARTLAARTGETLTEAVIRALRERLERYRDPGGPQALSEELLAIGARCSRLPLLDPRPAEEILGYDRAGLPG